MLMMIHNHRGYTTDTVEFTHAFSEFPMHIIILKYKEVNCMSVLLLIMDFFFYYWVDIGYLCMQIYHIFLLDYIKDFILK